MHYIYENIRVANDLYALVIIVICEFKTNNLHTDTCISSLISIFKIKNN
jgi:hypothetical protein